jgi:glycosyltransferase involved in cell wall biosynthesis
VLAGAVRDLPRRPKVVAKISNPLAPSAIPALRALLARAFRWAARDVDWFAAMSTGLADDVRALTGRGEVSVIFDPNIDTIINLPDARKVPGTGPLHLLAAGRLVEQKDFGLAVRIVAELAKHRDVRLTIAGDGPDAAAGAAGAALGRCGPDRASGALGINRAGARPCRPAADYLALRRRACRCGRSARTRRSGCRHRLFALPA